MPKSSLIDKSLKVDPATADRTDRLVRQITGLSHSQVAGLFDHGCVTINAEPCGDGATLLSSGDVVAVRYDPRQRYRPKPAAWNDPAFEIVFEDSHLIVVNKAAGVLTVPTSAGDAETLVQAISHYLAARGGRERAQVVHRLDRGVSGLIVFGKTHEAATLLQSQFEDRKPEREYVALVKGAVPAEGTFESYLATTKNLQRYSTANAEEGELAITHYRLVKAVHGCSWVRVWLETGRRNQIRVHFAEAGHPVLGDPRYRPDLAVHSRWRSKRLALHAAVLGFRHPISGKALRFEEAMPAAMKGFVEK